VLPLVYDFRWEPTHLVFVGVFLTVMMTLASLLGLAALRTARTLRQGKDEAIRWREDFQDLYAADKACRHALTGETPHRVCQNGLDCRTCANHAAIRAASGDPPAPESAISTSEDHADEEIFGFSMPADRMYHRGHTWVHPQADGTVTVGLDAFASRLIGEPDTAVLPDPGTRLEVNGTAWRVTKGTAEARILSPVDGHVAERGDSSRGWWLRVQPSADGLNSGHLLERAEVRPWLLHEVERLQMCLADGQEVYSLADGGVPVEDLSAAIPEARRDAVLGAVLLDPC
jgi:hypothetical protein